MTTPPDNSLDALIASYLQAVERGEVPDRPALLSAHPEWAGPLRAFFADLDRMDRVAAPLKLDDPDATGDATSPPIGATLRYFGDYELLETIAKGGMGIVYKARQVSLNRVVALKMILAGTFATARERERFRSEAENAASLDHPSIVPIYEVGEHEGQQYFTMKFIDGRPLNEAPRLAIRDEVARMAVIARAVSFAHQRGILHRDLKPSNVLIGADGSPHVADFGLAKRLENRDRSLTETGQLIGTPRYMPPEQASGAKTLTVSADVYSLGAILYERLCGRPAFPGDNVMAVLDAVRNTPPPPVSSIESRIDRDLATLVHKSLEKLPAHRYATASDLADDLQRWLNGEPIEARPVGQAERFRRWCKRNPALATAGGLAAAALLLATLMSVAFSLQWRRRARAEADRAAVAKKAEDDAISSRDSLETTFARSFVRPLNPDPEIASLSEPEVQALWEMAGLDNDRVRLRFFDEALADPIARRQLAHRSAPAGIAAIGLDGRRRDDLARRALGRLAEPSPTLDQKVTTALIGLEFEDRPSEATRAYVDVVAQGFAARPPDPALPSWSRFLINHAGSIEPNAAGGLLAIAFRNDPANRHPVPDRDAYGLTRALAEASHRMRPSEAADALVRAIRSEDIALSDMLFLADVARQATDRMPPTDAGAIDIAIASRILEAVRRRGDADPQRAESARLALIGSADANTVLPRLAGRLEPARAVSLLEAAIRTERPNLVNRAALLRALASRADQESREAATRIGRELAEAAAKDLSSERKKGGHAEAASFLAAMSKQVEMARPEQAWAPAVATLASAVAEVPDHEARGQIAWALAPLAERLGRDEADRICSPIAESLTAMLDKEPVDGQSLPLARGLGALMLRVPPDQAARIARALAATAQRTARFNSGMAYQIHSILADLDGDDALRVVRILALAVAQEEAPEVRWFLAAALSFAVRQIDGEQAAKACGPIARRLAEAFVMPNGGGDAYILTDGFTKVIDRLSPAEAGQVAAVLESDLQTTRSGYSKYALVSAVKRLDADLAGHASRILPLMVDPAVPEHDKQPLLDAFRSLTRRMEPDEAGRMRDRAVGELAKSIQSAKDSHRRSNLMIALSSVASEMPPPAAARILSEALSGESDESPRQVVASDLAKVAKRMKPDEAAVFGLAAAKVLLRNHVEKLKEAIACLPPKTAADLLTGALETQEETGNRIALTESLIVTTDRCEPAEAARLRRLAFPIVMREADKTVVARLVFPRLTPARADALAAELFLVFIDGLNGDDPENTEDIQALLSDYPKLKTVDEALSMAQSALGMGSPVKPRCRLTTQQLVDVLKMPTCLGRARRAVLDHLGNRYGQTFANHWQFVRYAREHKLGLDFTTPPVRPDPKGLADRIRKILDDADGPAEGKPVH